MTARRSWIRYHEVRLRGFLPDGWTFGALVVAVLVMLPLMVVVVQALLSPAPEVWQHLWRTRLPDMLANTVVLLVGVGSGALLLGTGLAWLVTAYRFPGQRVFSWALVLPLAIPAYVLAYVFMVIFDTAGPVQYLLRLWLEGNVSLPPIRSRGGAILVMVLALYPYVYLLARAAFHEHATGTFHVARVLGASRTEAFFRVVLPMARPSLVAGLSLVLMEVLTEVGAVRFLNVPTLSDGIFRLWYDMVNREAAIRLAGLLLLFTFGGLVLERGLRGPRSYMQHTAVGYGIPQVPLSGMRKWAATLLCVLVLGAAFVLPVIQLLWWTGQTLGQQEIGLLLPIYWRYVRNTWFLATLAAVSAVGLAILLAYGVRLSRTSLTPLLARSVALGYAVPGAVLGLGVLLTLSWVDHRLNVVSRAVMGVSLGLLLTGSFVGLTYAYVVRFMAVAYGGVEASLEKVSAAMEDAARSLGSTRGRVLLDVHLPLIRAGTVTAALMVFVDVVKELPVTLMLRPFGYETLALWVWQEVSESLWENASFPALVIVITGLIPVIITNRLAHIGKISRNNADRRG